MKSLILFGLLLSCSFASTDDSINFGFRCRLNRPKVVNEHWPRLRNGELMIHASGKFEFSGSFFAFNKRVSIMKAKGISQRKTFEPGRWSVELLATERTFLNENILLPSLSETFPETLGKLLVRRDGEKIAGSLNDINATSYSNDGFPAAEGTIEVNCEIIEEPPQ